MNLPQAEILLARYRSLTDWVALTESDRKVAHEAWLLLRPHAPTLVDDFYDCILRNPETASIIQDDARVQRLKRSLAEWLDDLFTSPHDSEFVQRRWQVGMRHVQIGLPSIWVSVAMSRLREQAIRILSDMWTGEDHRLRQALSALGRMLDVDLALIQDAYNTEQIALQIAHERDFAEGVIETSQAVVMVVGGEGEILRGNTFLQRAFAPLDTDSDGESSEVAKDAIHHPRSSSPCAPRESDFIPSHINGLLQEHDCDRFLAFIAQVIQGEQPSPLETTLHHEDFAPRRVRWLARACPRVPALQYDWLTSTTTENRKVSRDAVLCVGQDISDLSKAQEQLVRHARLAAIGQTMTGLAHESRNAFQRSQAALETLLLELEERPAAVQLIERIQRAHDHLLHLYEEVLEFARPVRLELQTVQLDGLIQQTWDHLSGIITERAIECDLHVDDTALTVQADPFAIEQVLRNILENAIQASNPGGNLEIHLQNTSLSSAPAVEVIVRDFGAGLPPAHRERLFDPFFTTRPRGTGLGLPIARRLAESHGGNLELVAADPGTIARLVLPKVAVPQPEEPVANEDFRRPNADK